MIDFKWICYFNAYKVLFLKPVGNERVKKRHEHCLKSARIRSFSGPYFPAFATTYVFFATSSDNSITSM